MDSSITHLSLTPERCPKILSIHLYPYIPFKVHSKEPTTRAYSRLGILKALAGANRGQSKEPLLVTFKAFHQISDQLQRTNALSK